MIKIEGLEHLVLALAKDGYSIEEIAQQTGFQTKSVKKLFENLSRKINAAIAAERKKI